MVRVCSALLLMVAIVDGFRAAVEQEGTCDVENEECSNSKDGGVLYGRESARWQHYLDLINISMSNYSECNQGMGVVDCECLKFCLVSDLSLWVERGGIHLEDFRAAQAHYSLVHYQIINHTLLRQPHCCFSSRCVGVEHFLLQLIPVLPDMEFLVNVMDYPLSSRLSGDPLPILSFSKTSSYYDIMYPAWSFWAGGPAIATEPLGLGRWDLKRTSLAQASQQWPWDSKRDLGFFRGSRTSPQRDPLIILSRQQPHSVDAQYTRNQAWHSEQDTLGAAPASVVTMEEHCQYKYLFNFRGVAASFRLRHLFLCGSLVLHVGEEWQEFFYPSLRPWVHYVPLHTHLGDLQEMLQFLRAHDSVAKAIASRGKEHIWGQLSMDSVICYWRALLLEYAKLTTWTVVKEDSYITQGGEG